VHGLAPGTPASLGAAFTLYVLDVLGQAVAAGTVLWNEPLTVTAPLKSLPPGELQDEPGCGGRVQVVVRRIQLVPDGDALDAPEGFDDVPAGWLVSGQSDSVIMRS
jgi:hypothetical protein